MTTPHDPFGRSRLPSDFTREQRVRLLAEVADALLSRRTPSVEAAMFVGGALAAWLESGGGVGSLERDHLRVVPPKGSRLTPTEVLRRARAEPHCNEGEPWEEGTDSDNNECDTKGTSNDDEHDHPT